MQKGSGLHKSTELGPKALVDVKVKGNRSRLEQPCFLIGKLQEPTIVEVMKKLCFVDIVTAPPSPQSNAAKL